MNLIPSKQNFFTNYLYLTEKSSSDVIFKTKKNSDCLNSFFFYSYRMTFKEIYYSNYRDPN